MTDITHVNDGKDMKDIHHCCICERRLFMPRVHVDTCGQRCFHRLLEIQRRQLHVSVNNG